MCIAFGLELQVPAVTVHIVRRRFIQIPVVAQLVPVRHPVPVPVEPWILVDTHDIVEPRRRREGDRYRVQRAAHHIAPVYPVEHPTREPVPTALSVSGRGVRAAHGPVHVHLARTVKIGRRGAQPVTVAQRIRAMRVVAAIPFLVERVPVAVRIARRAIVCYSVVVQFVPVRDRVRIIVRRFIEVARRHCRFFEDEDHSGIAGRTITVLVARQTMIVPTIEPQAVRRCRGCHRGLIRPGGDHFGLVNDVRWIADLVEEDVSRRMQCRQQDRAGRERGYPDGFQPPHHCRFLSCAFLHRVSAPRTIASRSTTHWYPWFLW